MAFWHIAKTAGMTPGCSPPLCKLHAAITWARRSNLSPSSSFSACLFVFVNKSSSATPEQVAPQVWSIREKLQLLWCWFGEYLLASDKKYHSQMGNRPSKCSVSACLSGFISSAKHFSGFLWNQDTIWRGEIHLSQVGEMHSGQMQSLIPVCFYKEHLFLRHKQEILEKGPQVEWVAGRFPRHHLLDIREVNLDKFYLEQNDLLGCTLHLVWDSRSAGVGSICFLLFTLYHLMFLLCLWYHSFQMFLTSVQSSWCCGSNTYQLCPCSSFMPCSAAAGSHSSNSRRAAQA